jgi:hypothetical protein
MKNWEEVGLQLISQVLPPHIVEEAPKSELEEVFFKFGHDHQPPRARRGRHK